MNLTIDTTDVARLRDSLAVFSDRRFAAGLATALTRTAQAARAAAQHEIRDSFDRPTPFTLGQVYARAATAAQLVAAVGVSDAPYTVGYLKPHIFGGERRHKRFEKLLIGAGAMPSDRYAVPGRFARLDAYGNVSRGTIRQILSHLRIEPTEGAASALPLLGRSDKRLLGLSRAARSALAPPDRSDLLGAQARRRRIDSAYRRAGGQYIALPNGRGRLLPGIYRVRATAWGRSAPQPVLVFVRWARYEAGRFDFFYAAHRAAAAALQREMDAAMAEQLRRWQQKYGGPR